MKIAIVTSIKAPYRTLQLENICKESDVLMTVYYTQEGKEDRLWETRDGKLFNEIYLKKIKSFNKYGNLNCGLFNIVKDNDVIVLGGYEKPTYILLALLCKFFKKKYILIFDGISVNKLDTKESILKKYIKNFVIKNSKFIWGNGTVSERYFCEKFNYPKNKIYNQYLTVDSKAIKEIGKNKRLVRKELRGKYNIEDNMKILHYSGRLVELKNIKRVIMALSKIKDKSLILLITGGGEQEAYLKKIANELDVNIIITGFIDNQYELFKHYFMSDVFILPSVDEAWGLVVNEAMFSGLPVLVSNICGCSLDLVKGNGYLINPFDIEDIKMKIEKIFFESDLNLMGKYSEKIIEEYNFKNSALSFINMIKEL